ncbi:MAG: aminotransferase class I/II-fold pyridoxal phosphate-dependent enzyme, partial [bacterium]
SGTLSKALGSLGGYVAGPKVLRAHLIQNSRAFIYATALPASCVAAALEALRVLQSGAGPLRRLRENRAALAHGLNAQGWSWGASQSPILPVIVGKAEAAVALEQRLWDAGYYVPAMRPPTVPAGSCRLRVTVGAGHQPEHIAGLLRALGTKA